MSFFRKRKTGEEERKIFFLLPFTSVSESNTQNFEAREWEWVRAGEFIDFGYSEFICIHKVCVIKWNRRCIWACELLLSHLLLSIKLNFNCFPFGAAFVGNITIYTNSIFNEFHLIVHHCRQMKSIWCFIWKMTNAVETFF